MPLSSISNMEQLPHSCKNTTNQSKIVKLHLLYTLYIEIYTYILHKICSDKNIYSEIIMMAQLFSDRVSLYYSLTT